MALQLGTTKISGMQYNGVTIGEAMYNGQIVYRSIVRVVPVAPTFLPDSPWITLPTVQGVAYSIVGTPNYGSTVLVTATAQAGYELEGVTSWSHRFSAVVDAADIRVPLGAPHTSVIPAGASSVTRLGSAVTEHEGGTYFGGSSRLQVTPSVLFGGTFSASMWVKTSHSSGYATVAQARASASNEWWIGIAGGDGNVNVGWRNNGANPLDVWGPSGVVKVNDNLWHHIMFTVSAATNYPSITLWVDGVNRAFSSGGYVVYANPAHSLYLAGSSTAASYTGAIDDVSLWGGPTSPVASTIYQQGRIQ